MGWICSVTADEHWMAFFKTLEKFFDFGCCFLGNLKVLSYCVEWLSATSPSEMPSVRAVRVLGYCPACTYGPSELMFRLGPSGMLWDCLAFCLGFSLWGDQRCPLVPAELLAISVRPTHGIMSYSCIIIIQSASFQFCWWWIGLFMSSCTI